MKKVFFLGNHLLEKLNIPDVFDYQSEDKCEEAIRRRILSTDINSKDIDRAELLVECGRREHEIIHWSNAILYFCFIPGCLLLFILAILYKKSSVPLYIVSFIIMGVIIFYRMTFYRYRFQYLTTLAKVKDKLLAIAEKRNVTPKGNLPVFLLEELIKKELGKSNVFDFPESRVFYVEQRGWSDKNFDTEFPNYRSRSNLKFASENARTTHTKYLDTLIKHYTTLNEKDFLKQAEDLKTYFERVPLKKK